MTTRRLSRLKLAQATVIAAAAYPAVTVLGRTLRWKVDGYRHLEDILLADQQPIMAFWHGRILAATYFFRQRGIVVMTSENFDGEWIGRVIRKFGYGVARGSTSRGGRRALVELRREMRAGKATAFTLDGPRGPARVAQPGAVWLAGLTGNPILPFHIEAAGSWELSSWDRSQVPKPFSQVAVAIGEPIRVAPAASADELEADRGELERSLACLVDRTGEMLAG